MNERDVRLTYRFLGHKNETEIRIIDPTKCNPPLSVWVSDEEHFVDICKMWDGKRNIYVGINERKSHGTKCEDVVSVNAIIFDIDSDHPKDTPATDDERMKAWTVAESAVSYLKDMKHIPFIAMSGNGWQIWVKIDIEINSDNYKKIEGVIKDIHKGMIHTFSTNCGIIDNIGDLARVIKVIGTTSVKINPFKDRPNLESCWFGRKPIYVKSDYEWSKKIVSLSKNYIINKIDSIDETQITPLTDEEIKRYYNILPKYVRAWFDGSYEKFKSRSEAEFAILMFLAESGVPKNKAYSFMYYSKTNKWTTGNGAYRRLTIDKVYDYTKNG